MTEKRRRSAELERDGGRLAALGGGLTLLGWFLLGPGFLVGVGIVCLVLGLIMWGAGMARSA